MQDIEQTIIYLFFNRLSYSEGKRQSISRWRKRDYVEEENKTYSGERFAKLGFPPVILYK